MQNSSRDVQLTELKDTILQLNNTVSTLNTTVAAQLSMMQEKDATIAKLTEEIAYLRRKLFGSSSEQNPYVNPDQLTVYDLLGVEAPVVEIEPEYTTVKEHTRERKKKPSLDEQFKGLTTEEVYLNNLSDAEKICGICGTPMLPIGTEVVRSELVYNPGILKRIIYYSTTYGCPNCKDTDEPQFIKDNQAPAALIEGSYVTSSLAAAVLKNKFELAVPFYRQEKDFKAMNAPISRTTMASWAITLYEKHFSVLVDYFHRELLKRQFVMMDETTTQVLKEPDKRPQSKSYIWLMRSGEDGLPPLLLYHYAPTRSGDIAVELLKGSKSGLYLMADGYSGYNKVKDVTRCCCYAHIRRYFYDAIPKGKSGDFTNPAVQGVMYCDKLFSFERRYREKGLSYEQRYKQRLKDEKPVVEAFIKWIDAQRPSSTSQKFNTALSYVRNRKEYMTNYLLDGRCSLSNNLSENSVRPVTVGRKNWLFSDTVDGANASMGIYTIIEMAKLYNLKRYDYLKYLLDHRPTKDMSDEELAALAPWSEEVQKCCAISPS